VPALNLALRTPLPALFLLLGLLACGGGGKGTEPTRPSNPVISDLVVSAPDGHKASLGWRTDRPCSATVSYQKPGGTPMTRRWTDARTARQVALDLLEPGTSYTLTLQVKDADQNTSTASTQVITGPSSGAPGIRITVDPSTTRSISPYIYGLNYMAMIGSENAPHVPQRLTLDRVGGNRWTVYNWENNASNAGIDWHFTSDGFLGGGETPAEAVRLFVEAARNRGQASIITVPIQGYVAADKAGPVDPSGGDLATRFKQVIPKKAAKSAVPFTSAPDLTDPYVFVDEFLWTFQNRFKTEGDPSSDVFASSATHPVLVSLDNEPDLWHSTHTEVQGTTLHPSTDLLARTQAAAKALKDQFPAIQLLGPAHYGINGLYSWRDTYPADPGGDWFMDHYLREMKAASDQDGRRLLDVFDFHWYPEISVEGKHIFRMNEAELNEAQVQAIVQSPRDWWDAGFVNKDSWLPALLGGPTRFLDRVQSKVEAAYPGTRIAITEYYYGGGHHIAGAIAQADNLGIFGSRGVHAATLWPAGECPYPLSAFQAYRGFDGGAACFGDTSLSAVSSDAAKVSSYVSRDSAHPGRTVIVAINRSAAAQDVAFSGLSQTGIARVYRMDASQYKPFLAGQMPVDLGQWVVCLPPLSVSTIEVQ